MCAEWFYFISDNSERCNGKEYLCNSFPQLMHVHAFLELTDIVTLIYRSSPWHYSYGIFTILEITKVQVSTIKLYTQHC